MNNKDCKDLTFSECELAILRMAVDKADEKKSKRNINAPEVKKIIKIVEEFLRDKKLICYGGTAINNILPDKDKFYNKDLEIPDYDFFSPNALDDAKELADIYAKSGYDSIEAKSGVHHGTYKVYVNYIPVADITFLEKELFDSLKKEAIQVEGIIYTPPNFLRMSMYLELSRPAGDTSRWEKVLKRLILLNKNYPLDKTKCEKINFQRRMENSGKEELIYNIVKNSFIEEQNVFFGGYAISLYSQYMPRKLKKNLKKFADFDVIAHKPESVAKKVKSNLEKKGIKNISIEKHDKYGELIPEHFEIKINKDTIAFLYEPVGCHSYNVIKLDGKKVRIATIDTMLSFYLAFVYINRPYYQEFKDRILCMANLLFDVQQKNRLKQKDILKRFSIICYGHQQSLEEIRELKAEKYLKLKDKKDDKEYNEWFLNYKPSSKKDKKQKEDKKDKEDKKQKEYKKDKEDKEVKQSTYKKHKKTKKIKNKLKSKQKKQSKYKKRYSKTIYSKNKNLNKLIYGKNYTRKNLY
jgi:hypothetical protein